MSRQNPGDAVFEEVLQDAQLDKDYTEFDKVQEQIREVRSEIDKASPELTKQLMVLGIESQRLRERSEVVYALVANELENV